MDGMTFGPQRDVGPMGTTLQTLSQHCLSGEGNPPISRRQCPAGKWDSAPQTEPLSLQISLSKSPGRGTSSPPPVPGPSSLTQLPRLPVPAKQA